MRAIICFILVTMIMLTSGCEFERRVNKFFNPNGSASASIVDAANASTEDAGVVKRHAASIGKSVEGIDESANTIDSANQEIASLSQDPLIRQNSEVIRQEVGEIKQETSTITTLLEGIDERTGEILESNNRILDSNQNVVKLENENARLIAEKDKANEKAKESLYKTLAWFFGVGVAIAIAGAVVLIWEKKIGMMIIAIGGATIGIAAATTFYLEWVAIIGGITILISIFGTIGLLIWRYRKTLFQTQELQAADNAATEVITFIDKIVKPALPDDVREVIFGDNGMANKFQTEETRRVINAKRKSLDIEDT